MTPAIAGGLNYLVLIAYGLVIGVIVAAPVGPVNLICIRRAMAFGPLNGFVSGLGAALGDAVFASITAFGLTAISKLVEDYSVYLQIGGGILLLIFGLSTYFAEPMERNRSKRYAQGAGTSLARAMLSAFALTITNPATLFGFAAIFAGLGGLTGESMNFPEAAVVVGGVLCGSALWWFALTTLIGLFHAKIDDRIMHIINHGSGILVSLFGVAVLARLAFRFL
ncbi:MAG TPA: LysE family transporter [Rhizomicrobium sp.]|jgi:threonine/homoserine/homoserine lactone efflux protein|nr:LysE family transporter [Rhizomicrobium sp.]